MSVLVHELGILSYRIYEDEDENEDTALDT